MQEPPLLGERAGEGAAQAASVAPGMSMNLAEDALYAMLGRLYVSWQLRVKHVEALEEQNRKLSQALEDALRSTPAAVLTEAQG